MENQDLRNWESADDLTHSEPLAANLPTTYPIGGKFVDGNRLWQRVRIVTGKAGGKWAYWVGATHRAERVQPNDRFEVIVDSIFNGDAFHFVGMLAIPYTGKVLGMKDVEAWVLVEPRIKEVPSMDRPRFYRDDRDTLDGKRYEKSKEVYDVETKESTILE